MKISISIPNELHQRIKKYKCGVLQINISKICAKAIEKALDKLEK